MAHEDVLNRTGFVQIWALYVPAIDGPKRSPVQEIRQRTHLRPAFERSPQLELSAGKILLASAGFERM